MKTNSLLFGKWDENCRYLPVGTRVTAEWINTMDCSGALDVLIDILWEATDEKTRTMIFAIIIHDKHEQLHCWSPPLHQAETRSEVIA